MTEFCEQVNRVLITATDVALILPYQLGIYPASINLFKGNNANTKKICKNCPKLTIKTPEQQD